MPHGKKHHGFKATRARAHPTWTTLKMVPNGHLFSYGSGPWVQPLAPLPNLTCPARGFLPDGFFWLPGRRWPPAVALKFPPPVGPDEPGMPLSLFLRDVPPLPSAEVPRTPPGHPTTMPLLRLRGARPRGSFLRCLRCKYDISTRHQKLALHI